MTDGRKAVCAAVLAGAGGRVIRGTGRAAEALRLVSLWHWSRGAECKVSVRAAVEAVGALGCDPPLSPATVGRLSRWLEREIRVLAMLAAGIDPGWIARSERCRRETVEAIRERAREREAEGVAAACRGAQSAESGAGGLGGAKRSD